MGYRKLTTTELKAIVAQVSRVGNILPTTLKYYQEYVHKYFPPKAVAVAVVTQSEYNDETYDNRMAQIVVYDAQQNELAPLKATAKEARQVMFSMPLPFESQTDQPITDELYFLLNGQPTVPDVYVKES